MKRLEVKNGDANQALLDLFKEHIGENPVLDCQECEEEPGLMRCSRCHNARYCSVQCQKRDWKQHKRCCFRFPEGIFEETRNKILHEAHRMNLFTELKALETRRNEGTLQDLTYDGARYFLYKGIVGMILFDPVSADLKENMSPEETQQWDGFCADIRQAYRLMEQVEPGIFWDSQDLLWLFIPKALHHDIESICNVA